MIMFAVMLLLVSCGKVPQEKYDIAKSCIDSLANVGAKSSVKFDDLQDRMKIVDENIEKQNTMLFKKYDFVSSELDNIIRDSRRFIITYDRPTKTINPVTTITNSNSIRLEVEITFDSEQDALKIASLVDQAVRGNMNLNAKLISVKIME